MDTDLATTDEFLMRLSELLLKEQDEAALREKNEKLKRILLLLARGSMLAVILAAPKTGRLFKSFLKDDSEWQDWKIFNQKYLRRTLKKLEQEKFIEVIGDDKKGVVKITENGKRKILALSVESITLQRPSKWDKKWRIIFYDVLNGKQTTRDKFRSYLKSAGFYPLQESVFLHAFDCEKEIEFLKHYLGIGNEVRIVIADKIENDQVFRDYFGMS